MIVLDALGHALSLAAAMAWEILWALTLGFAISGAVQAVVSKAEMGRLLPDDSPRSLTIACGLGAASSSCSYAAVAMARSVFRKGADFTSAMAFQFASTNLVVELGIILAVLLGWQFTAAEFVGGPLMIVLLALLFRALLKPRMVQAAREQADKGLVGLPILNIYRKYYGRRMSLFLLGTFYLTMAAAGLAVDLAFETLGLVPEARNAKVVEASFTWNYTTVLNLVFLLLAAVLLVRFLRTKGPEMLRMMNAPSTPA